ncbi:amidohydrolase family protein [Novipirellula artificiosorum]|uniref:Amidohydrolase-related domain-containing protein n=1 Tax=Novipirellula artificiosorum TaxID=2528016 RepID=A0A5C6DVL9_9BACT|nr:amidohydrolase family protein [Novipirellula artificiosorum]TWU40668.1 hypothetical protein Poly41_15030 [Novipirellula artificiosorum]
MKHLFLITLASMVLLFSAPPTMAQRATTTRPVVGLRQADRSAVLLSGAEVVCDPDSAPQSVSVLIEGTSIVAVGNELNVPAGTEVRDLEGKRIYAGLVDAMHDVELPDNLPTSHQGYWNENVSPQYKASWFGGISDGDLDKLHSQGITVQLVAPQGGIIKGSSCVVLALKNDHPQFQLQPQRFQHLSLTVPRGERRNAYPNSPMGAVALVRQALYDALWYREANRIFENDPKRSRPEPNESLAQLAEAIESGTFVIDAPNERMALRAAKLADEFSIDAVLRGSGYEYCELAALAASGHPILVPVDFPETPDTKTAESIRETSLRQWMHWRFAPENPARLTDSGVRFCLTTDGLEDVSKFLSQIRTAVDRGLDTKTALAAVTTVPAALLGIDDRVGKIQPGMLANLVVTDGDLFDSKTKVHETWVVGERFEVETPNFIDEDRLLGTWLAVLPSGDQRMETEWLFEQQGEKWGGSISLVDQAQPASTTDPSESSETQPKKAKWKDLVRQRERFSASVQLRQLSEQFSPGVSRVALLTVSSPDQPYRSVSATLTTPDGHQHLVSLKRKPDESSSKVIETGEAEENDDGDAEEPNRGDEDVPRSQPEIALVYPLGAYGLEQKPVRADSILFRGATVWTSGPLGKIEGADVRVRDGKIAEVGHSLVAEKGCLVVSAKGKHITAGLIDCHSHMATDGGVNESGQAVTSEVRIADFIDNSDITIYRQLAGGVTASQILHGSANPIGGQSQVIKLRWGAAMEEMLLKDAPWGIKFALGENVKRSSGRYPNTRMGVEQIIRDQFLAARQYEADRQAWQAGDRRGLPPRRDLQLDALVEIQRGDRWIHCHSYRQDEIVATLDVLEEFGIRIGTLQHILEGYKVADRMAQHGAMASTFADWWAYKFEVYDAIPYNGVIMHNAGVVVSYNSDDAELGRHLNTEAAKATKYGGVPEQEALQFVTLNPAKQLRLEDRIGSIEVGKDADLVVWSGPPLSATTRCEQTWIDGIKYFDLELDHQLRTRDARLRAQLVQMGLDQGSQPVSETKNGERSDRLKDEPIEEADRWDRVDIYCNAGRTTGASR